MGLFSFAGLSQNGFFGVQSWALLTLSFLVLLAAMTASAAALHVSIFCILVVLSTGRLEWECTRSPSWVRSPAMAWWCSPLRG